MMREILAPTYGTFVIEDTQTGELSLQTICGGIAMYYQRIILSEDEAHQLRNGTLDIASLTYQMGKDAPEMERRFVPPIPIDQIVQQN